MREGKDGERGGKMESWREYGEKEWLKDECLKRKGGRIEGLEAKRGGKGRQIIREEKEEG